MYSINSTDLATFGIIPVREKGIAYAITGMMDFPKRKGDTYHNWGIEIEAFISSGDMLFEGRDIILNGIIQSSTKATLDSNLSAFTTLCKSGELTLITPVGTVTVYLTGGIEVKEITELIYSFTANFYEPTVTFSSYGAASGGSGYLLENYNLNTDFGITVQFFRGRKSEAKRIDVATTDFYTGVYRDQKNLSLECIMQGASISELKSQMDKFHGLLSSAGLKTLTDLNGDTYETYITDGFTVDLIPGNIAKFTINMKQ